MKEFWIYTALRILLFFGSAAVVFGIYTLFTDRIPMIYVLLFAAIISSVLSWKLLAGPRERFAARVQARAENAATTFEKMKAKEDAD